MVKRVFALLLALALFMAGCGRNSEDETLYLSNTGTNRYVDEDADAVYIIHDYTGEIYRFDKKTLAYEPLVTDVRAEFLLLWDGSLYFIDYSTHSIMRANPSNGDSESLHEYEGSFQSPLIPYGGRLYFETTSDGREFLYQSLDVKSGEVQVIPDVPEILSSIFMAYSGNWLYVTGFDGPTIRTRPDGTEKEVLDDTYWVFSWACSEGIFYMGNERYVFLGNDGSEEELSEYIIGTAGDLRYYISGPQTGSRWLTHLDPDGTETRLLRVWNTDIVNFNPLHPDFWFTEDWIFFWSVIDSLSIEDGAVIAPQYSLATGAALYLYALRADGSELLVLDTYIVGQ